MSSQLGLGNEMYTGAASFGQIRALIVAVIGTIISIIMIVIGIYMLFKKKINTVSVDATILNLNCNSVQNNIQNCNLNLSYNYNGIQNRYVQYSGNIVYSVNQKLTVYVDTDNGDVYLDFPSPKEVGSVLLILGFIILIGCWFMYWLTKRYKFFAAAEGVSGAFNLFRS
jgi:hypothetical protein